MTVFLKNLDLSKIKPSRRRSSSSSSASSRPMKRKIKSTAPIVPFPVKLYQMLQEVEEQGLEHIVSWQGNGRSFQVHNPTRFVKEILPNYFRCSKLKSFQRQLNFYKFIRAVSGPLEGSYSHPSFMRGEEELVKTIKRHRESKPILDVMFKNTAQEQEAPPEPLAVDSSDDDSLPDDIDEAILSAIGREISNSAVRRRSSVRRDSFKIDPAILEAVSEEFTMKDTEKPSPSGRRDSLQVFLESSFGSSEPKRRESFRDGKRLSFVGKKFFFLPVEFTDLYGC